MKLYRIALRNISRNRRRSLLSASAIAIAACTIVFLFAMFGGMLGDMESNLWTYMTGAVRIRHSDFDKYERLNPMHLAVPDYRALVAEIQKHPAVTALSPRINFPGRVPVGGIGSDRKVGVKGIGVDFDLEVAYQDYGRTLVEGRLPEMGMREAAVGRGLAEKLSVGVGDKFTVLSQSGSRGSNAFTLTVTGILAIPVTGLDNVTVQVPLDTVQRLLWLPDKVQEILIKVDSSLESPKSVADGLRVALVSDVPLNVWDFRKINSMAASMDLAKRVYDIIAVIFFLLASTVIVNTTIMVIFERMREIGTLTAMGMSGRNLVTLFFLEALFISLAGAVAGIAAGIGLTGYYGITGISSMADAMEGMDTDLAIGSVLYPVLNFKSTVGVFLYALAVTALATWWPARRAARISPVEALRG